MLYSWEWGCDGNMSESPHDSNLIETFKGLLPRNTVIGKAFHWPVEVYRCP
nr:MAG TPA: hypothetical protein [Caudoviricetes sp.]